MWALRPQCCRVNTDLRKYLQDFTIHRVLVEDSNRTNMLCHFEETYDIIQKALKADEGILVHCQAGVSRSTTLVAAFLMREHALTADGTTLFCYYVIYADGSRTIEAISQISAIRSQVEPTDFFLHQLEMYERMNYEVDPAKYAEYRRFLMVRPMRAPCQLSDLVFFRLKRTSTTTRWCKATAMWIPSSWLTIPRQLWHLEKDLYPTLSVICEWLPYLLHLINLNHRHP